jgi:hypothetical protein
MALDTVNLRSDVEFERDVLEAAKNLGALRARPLSLPAFKQVCVSLRKAKLLLWSIERSFEGVPYAGSDRLLKLAGEAVAIAADAAPRVPEALRGEFELIQKGILRHDRELKARHRHGLKNRALAPTA